MISWGIEDTTTTGTGDLTTTRTSGFPRPTDFFGLGHIVPYDILDSSGNPIEEGIGYYSAVGTFKRTRVDKSFASPSTLTNASASAVSLASGTKKLVVGLSANSYAPGLLATSDAHGFGANQRGLINAAYGLSAAGDVQFGATDTADRLNGWPFLLESELDTDAFLVHVAAAETSKSMWVGLYEMNVDGSIGNLVVKGSTAFDTTSIGNKTSTYTRRRLTKGWYWCILLSNGTSHALSATGLLNRQTPIGLTDGCPYALIYKVVSAGSLTDMPAGPLTGFTLTSGTTNSANVVLRVA